MPTISQDVASANDLLVNVGQGTVVTGTSLAYVGSQSSTVYNQQSVYYFPLATPIPQFAYVTSATFRVNMQTTSPANPITVETYLDASLNPVLPTTVAEHTGKTLTTAKVETVFAASTAQQQLFFDIAPMLNEQTKKGVVQGILVVLRDKVPNFVNNNRLPIRFYEHSSPRPSLAVNYSNMNTATGSASDNAETVSGTGAMAASSAYTATGSLKDGTEYIPPMVVDRGETISGTATLGATTYISGVLVDNGETAFGQITPVQSGVIDGAVTDPAETISGAGQTANVAQRGRLEATDNGETISGTGTTSSQTVYGNGTVSDPGEAIEGTGVNPVSTTYIYADLIDPGETLVSTVQGYGGYTGSFFATDPEETISGVAEFARGAPIQNFRVYRAGANIVVEIRADKSLLSAAGSSYFWNYYGAPTGLSMYRVKTGIRYPLALNEDAEATPQLEADVFRGTYPAKDLPDGEYHLQGYVKSRAGRATVIGEAQGVTAEKTQVITFTLIGGKAKDYSDVDLVEYPAFIDLQVYAQDYDLVEYNRIYDIIELGPVYELEEV